MLYRTLRKVPGTNTNIDVKKMYEVTPRCAAAAAAAAAAVVSAVVGAPTKEYAHPYSMMHRRLTTASIEVAPHYHQLLVSIVPGIDNYHANTYDTSYETVVTAVVLRSREMYSKYILRSIYSYIYTSQYYTRYCINTTIILPANRFDCV